MLARIKTLEELKNTEGVWKSEYGFEYKGGFGEFDEEMHKMCGKIIEIKEASNKVLFQTLDEKFAIEEWMCSEWDIKEDDTFSKNVADRMENAAKTYEAIEGKDISKGACISVDNLRDTVKLFRIEPPKETVNHPSHYNTGKYEVIDVIEDWDLNFNLGNAIKYIARCNHKGNKEEDLKKAMFYINREIGKGE